ncbi:MAG: hypothetical protein LBL80_05430 [Ruminococcus sp.]|jgi:hypothetical protein|nr:hypothetical protein [Ruminococcus sp.]
MIYTKSITAERQQLYSENIVPGQPRKQLHSVLKTLCQVLSVLFVLSIFSACNIGFTADSLLVPPKLSEEQQKVYDALTRAAGNDIRLKYPVSGQYRSAVTIADIDGDGGDEAVAFYERAEVKAAGDLTAAALRINILDTNEQGEWYSVYDHAGAGSDIDRMIISPLGNNDTPLITVGFIMLSGMKTARIYSYTDNRLSGEFSENYVSMFTADLDRDEHFELCLLHPNNADRQAYISLVSVEGNLIYEWGTADLNPTAGEYINIVSGVLSPKTSALYIDSSNGDSLRTDIVYSPAPGKLRNPMYLRESELIENTARPLGYLSTDIDGDKTLEIPVLSPFPGYSAAREEAVYSTNWMYLDNYTIKKKYSSYYSMADGFVFLFPQRWDGVVTVRTDEETGDIIFCKYTAGLSVSDMPELMRIAVTEGEASHAGYRLVKNKDNFYYYVFSPASHEEPLILTDTEIDNNFRLL